MSTFFVDTSALVKHYVREPDSAWVRHWITPDANNLIIISDLAVVELLSILARRKRSRALSTATVTRLRQAFTGHLQQEYLRLAVERLVLDRSGEIAFDHGLKTLDAIQLAAAISARETLQEAMTFISGDTELLAAAAAEGFAVDNPLNHP